MREYATVEERVRRRAIWLENHMLCQCWLVLLVCFEWHWVL